jgi:hypothetical protein
MSRRQRENSSDARSKAERQAVNNNNNNKAIQLPEAVEEAEEVGIYYSHSYVDRDANQSSVVVDAANIDPINVHLVAKLRLAALCKAMEKCRLRVRTGLLQGLNMLNPTFRISTIVETNNTMIALAMEAKGIVRRIAHISPNMEIALTLLESESKFYSTVIPSPIPTIGCGAFFVPKSNGMMRIICDGRYANVHFNPAMSKFSFFNLETMSNVIGNLSKNNNTWYALNFDLRHWFHQIPLPTSYHQYLGMKLREGEWFFPFALPMGWLFAPYLAQCATWALLFCPEDQTLLKELDIDFDFLEKTQEFAKDSRATPPTWIPLKSGGGIFVFLDNILVMTGNRAIAALWYKHIISTCRRFHAILKGLNEDTFNESTTEQDMETLRENSFIIMTNQDAEKSNEDAATTNPIHEFHFEKNKSTGETTKTIIEDGKKFGTSFTFLGVKWTHQTRQIVIKENDRESDLGKFIDEKKKIFTGSRRVMSGFLGKINWHRRVNGMKNFNADEEQTTALLGIYSIITPSLNISSEWDTLLPENLASLPANASTLGAKADEDVLPVKEIVKIGPFLEGLKSAWRHRFELTTTNNQGFSMEFNLKENVVFVATDASTSCNCIASFVYSPVALVSSSTPEEAESIRRVARVTTGFFDGTKKIIAIGEMEAIELGVREAIASNAGVRLIVLGTDNMNCKHWIERGHCHHQEVNAIMRRIYSLLNPPGSNNNNDMIIRLFVTYVPTDDNVADDPSRNTEWTIERLMKTDRWLKKAFAEADGLWRIIGSSFGTTTEEEIKEK